MTINVPSLNNDEMDQDSKRYSLGYKSALNDAVELKINMLSTIDMITNQSDYTAVGVIT